ncbi:hypothetical protein E2C01_088443 [Portunus trituberculatus]|uniref:Uncharacterized protein n=1 Tax=Portunus trituberculatus TaxID=210409 RepID=A0A5B7JEH4_PORTR|nr:hypothetical protein [Portunus trituberculatus]
MEAQIEDGEGNTCYLLEEEKKEEEEEEEVEDGKGFSGASHWHVAKRWSSPGDGPKGEGRRKEIGKQGERESERDPLRKKRGVKAMWSELSREWRQELVVQGQGKVGTGGEWPKETKGEEKEE